MKIVRVRIENYKSIKKIDFRPNDGLNIFIGENNCGKSNCFNAFYWMLGPSYPTFNSVDKNDYYLGDPNNKIFIGLNFDNGDFLELNETKIMYGEEKPGLFKNDGYINGEDRENYACAYVGVEREIVDYLPSNRWSLIGRFLLDINKRFQNEVTEEGVPKSELFKVKLDEIRDDILFSVEDEEGQNIMDRFITILKEESAKQMNKNEEDIDVNFNLYDPWNFYRTLQIIVNESDIDLQFQASQLGMGAQASITMAILKAYSELKLGGGNPIFIDEPELFLHPQAQRNFYRILKKLAEENDTQIFYTTHSPYLLSLADFDEIHLVRKTAENGTYIRCAYAEDFVQDLRVRHGIHSSPEDLKLHYKNAYEQTSDSLSSLEGFFAKKIILVEGESEALILPYFFDQLGYFDYVRENISIVKCGGKSELDRFYRLYSEFGIPCYIIFDGDRHNGNSEIVKNEVIFDVLGIEESPDFPDNEVYPNYLGFAYDFNHSLEEAGFEDVYNQNRPDRSPKGFTLFQKVKYQIEEEEKEIPSWVHQVVLNLLRMPNEVDSVLQREVQSDGLLF